MKNGSEIPAWRKAFHYGGLLLLAIGFTLFLSVFVRAFLSFGNHGPGPSFAPAAIGMVLMMLGGAGTVLGQAGVAGSGLVLSPKKARKDLEPWSRMGGGMLADALDEAKITFPRPQSGPTGKAPLSFDEALRRLDALHKEGLLSKEEHAEARAKILKSIGA